MYGKTYSKYNGNIIIMLYKIYLLLFQEASSTSSLNWKGVAKAGRYPIQYSIKNKTLGPKDKCKSTVTV
jgi:hypothetical protein